MWLQIYWNFLGACISRKALVLKGQVALGDSSFLSTLSFLSFCCLFCIWRGESISQDPSNKNARLSESNFFYPIAFQASSTFLEIYRKNYSHEFKIILDIINKFSIAVKNVSIVKIWISLNVMLYIYKVFQKFEIFLGI